jgi:hypothetical protein
MLHLGRLRPCPQTFSKLEKFATLAYYGNSHITDKNSFFSIEPMVHDMQRLQNALAYFGTVISFIYKMFMKLTPGANIIKLFTTVSYTFL